MLVVTFVAIIPLFEAVLGVHGSSLRSRWWLFLAVYVAYGVLYLVTAYCNVALVTGMAARLDGDEPRLAAGVARASRRMSLIALYALVSATLGLLAFLARMLINPIFGMVHGAG